MSVNEFRRLAAKIDQHMQQLSVQGVNDAPAIVNRMMEYVPDLHKIWVGTSDDELIALSNEFPGFYRYALIMEEAFEAERNKASRPYDGMAQYSEQHKQLAAQLLTTAATLGRGYQAFRGSGNLQVFQPQVNELDKLHRQWLSDLESFKRREHLSPCCHRWHRLACRGGDGVTLGRPLHACHGSDTISKSRPRISPG